MFGRTVGGHKVKALTAHYKTANLQNGTYYRKVCVIKRYFTQRYVLQNGTVTKQYVLQTVGDTKRYVTKQYMLLNGTFFIPYYECTKRWISRTFVRPKPLT
jgi:hypothetical protein